MTTFYVVRHGQSSWNAAGLLQGQAAGVELSVTGHEQARQVADQLAGHPIDAVYSSDLRRAVATAAVIAEPHHLDVRLEAGLRERAYGFLEGRSSAAAVELAGDVDWTDPDARPGDGESLRDVHSRVGSTVRRLSDAHPDSSVILVSHGDTIRVLLACVAGLGPEAIAWRDVPNGSVTIVQSPH